MKKYIDVSTHQGVIDWEKVKASGVDGAILRAGYGRNNIDKQFIRNISECNRLGIPCGVYWFSYAYTAAMAAKEAEYCLAAIKPYKVELPVCYDFEYDTVRYAKEQGVTVNKALATACVHAFCGAVEEAGYYTMNYANPDYLSTYFDSTVQQYDLWLAWYKSNPNPDEQPRDDCGIWQYSSKGSIDGIGGNVDIDAAYKDYKSIIAKVGLNGLGKTTANTAETEPVRSADDEAETETVWYADAQAWVMEKGISDGTKAEQAATRAEVWAMIYRAMNK